MISEEQKLTAWLEWKKWCNVWRVGEPQPTPEELAEGKEDTISKKERDPLFHYLELCIFQAIPTYIRPTWAKKFDDEKRKSFLDPIISAFDDCMKGKSKKHNAFYKDWIFQQARANEKQGAIYKSVENMLFSGRVGYIKDILKNYLLDQGTRPTGSNGKGTGKPSLSMQVDLPNGGSLEDVLPVQDCCDSSPSDREYMLKQLDTLLENPKYAVRDWLLIYSKAAGIPIYDPLVSEATDRGKSANLEQFHWMCQELKNSPLGDDLTLLIPDFMGKIRKKLQNAGNSYKKFLIEADKRIGNMYVSK